MENVLETILSWPVNELDLCLRKFCDDFCDKVPGTRAFDSGGGADGRFFSSSLPGRVTGLGLLVPQIHIYNQKHTGDISSRLSLYFQP